MRNSLKYTTILFLALLGVTGVSAQKKKKTAPSKVAAVAPQVNKVDAADTSSPKMVTITSAFKPVLKSAAKVNFVAATPVIDSSKIPVAYIIPSQNLFFTYQPVSLKPLALAVDSSVNWSNDQYVKLGAGNFSSFMGEAGFSFGDGQKSITNLRGSFLTATGHMFAQQASKIGIDALSLFHTDSSHEWSAHAFYQNSTQYFYGYQPNNLVFIKDNLLQRFNTVGVELGVQNQLENAFGIKYHPQLSFIRFADNRDANESDLVVKLPFQKVFNKFYAIDLGLTADISRTNYSLGGNSQPVVKNDIYYVHPAFLFTTPNVKLHLGIKPSWSNMTFALLPELTAEAKLQEDLPFVVEAGWTGYYNKNTYRTLAAINPWVVSGIFNATNTKINEQYLGIKGNSGSHLTYNARFSYLTLDNQALFLNDNGDGKTFGVRYEPTMNAIRLHGEVGYTIGEKVSVLGAATYTQYNNLSVNAKPYGLLPFEMTGTVRWKVLKDLQVKADAFLWDGAPYTINSGLTTGKADPVADINLGAEFTVLPKLNIWFQMNNMLNTAYERWHQYPTLGFTVMGGVVYSFR